MVYKAKACSGPRGGNGKDTKVFPAMEWLAAMCSHIPNRGEQMVRYYGWYSNAHSTGSGQVSRGKRQMAGKDDDIPCILEPQGNSKAFRKSWARLIQKIYEVDPLVCPRCHGTMRIISFIEDQQVIRVILEHLGIWLVRVRSPPKIHCLPVCIHNAGRSSATSTADDVSQILPHNDHFYGDPQYSWDDYIQA